MNKESNRPLTLLEISDSAKKRVALINSEFANGFEFIKNYPRSVTFFGSARIEPTDKYYKLASELAGKIVSELRYSVITGGGPGLMEAANKGAYEAGGNSVGLTIELPHEQKTNPYLTDYLGFHYFFSRKVCLAFSAEAYIFFPGGFGTLDEFTEILTLIQTTKIPQAPIILVGSDYWNKWQHFINDALLSNKYIEQNDTALYSIADDQEKILEIIRNAPVRFGERYDEKADITLNQNNHNGHSGPLSGPLSELSSKHCVPCEGGTLPLTHDQSEEYLKNVSQWNLVEDKELEKTYEFENFSEAMDFVNTVGKIAEAEGHHPDLKLHDYKKVTVHISTHSIGGLSENDFILASKIDDVVRK